MTASKKRPGEGPKKKSLDLLRVRAPIAQVQTSIGPIDLYPLRVRDLSDFQNLESAEANLKVRKFLPNIGSLTAISEKAQEYVPLSQADVQALSDDEVETIADTYLKSYKRWNGGESKPIARDGGETASAYLVRLMSSEIEWHEISRKQFLQSFSIPGTLLNQVRNSTSSLALALGSYGKLVTAEKEPPQLDRSYESRARSEAERRSENTEWARQNLELTAASAQTLADLGKVATTLMEQLNERAQKTHSFTVLQACLAGFAIVVAIVLPGAALYFTWSAYEQDKDSAITEKLWHSNLLTVIEQESQQLSLTAYENLALRQQVKVLDTRIAGLEGALGAALQREASKETPDLSINTKKRINKK